MTRMIDTPAVRAGRPTHPSANLDNPSSGWVYPGQRAVFRFTIRIPDNEPLGIRTEHFDALGEHIRWFTSGTTGWPLEACVVALPGLPCLS